MDGPPDHTARSVDETAIRDLEAAYDRAWGDADLSGLVAHFASEATVVDPFGGVSEGRAAIRRLLGELLAGSGRGTTHTSTITRVTFVNDDVALADGEALIEGLRGPDGEFRPALLHRFTDVLVRGRDGWRIAHVRAYVLMDGPRP
jgi:uncharacterized protein (TIGR02246 family)